MEIRKLKLSDYDEMASLWSRANLPIKPEGRDSRAAIAVQMKANPDFFLGACENSRLVGLAIITSDLRKGWINRLAVDPDYQDQGIAKALVAECEKILRKHGVTLFCALIEDANTASRSLFRKCGYTEHHDILYFSKRDSDTV